MADPAELSPSELDDLEDALEGLESGTPPGVAPHLRRRLDDYRNILTLSRSALPMVEIPRGLLDDVLAQARAAAEVPTVTPTPAPVEKPSLWTRFRRLALLPGVALAGTAAVVLLMVERDPKHDVAPSAEQAVASAPADNAGADAKLDRGGRAAAPASAKSSTPMQGAAQPAGAVAPPPPPREAPADAMPSVDAQAQQEAPEPEAASAEEKSRRKDVSKGEADLPSAAPAFGTDPDMPRWDIIARGDRARHRGDCRLARNEYALALADADGRVRARAHAGLGLCDASEGDRTSADAAYRAARELDAEIVQFIDEERPRSGSGASQSKAAKAKPASKPKNADALEGL
jgi:hypothetical protein